MPESTTKLGKRELAKIQKKEAILAATLKVLTEKGHRDTTIEDIAEAAGVAKGTLYLYFTGKEDLVAATFTDYYTRTLGPYQDLDLTSLSKSEILAVFESMLNYGIQAADVCTVFFEVMGPELRQPDSAVVEMAKRCFADLSAIIEKEMRKLAEAGRLTLAHDPVGIGRTIAATTDGIILHGAFFKLPREEYELAVKNYMSWMDMLIKE